MKTQLEVYIDGASRGNPGPSAVGIYIKDSSGTELVKRGEYVGETTNNVAEYQAIIRSLKHLAKSKLISVADSEITIHSDSELVIKQLSGDYRIKSQNLIPLAIEARKLMKKVPHLKLNFVDRKNNKIADKLANKAMNLQDDIDELEDSSQE